MTAGVAYATATCPSNEELVQQHAPLVRRIALHLAARLPSNVELDDLMQSGLVGLLEAARSFEQNHGASFASFAGHRIRGAMLDELRRGDWAPRSVHRQARAVYQARDELQQRLGRVPTVEEVAEAIDATPADCQRILDDASRCHLLSLDSKGPNDDEGAGLVESIASGAGHIPHRQQERSALKQSLAEAIRRLPERDQLVLSLYYRDELHQKEIGSVLGVSESRVCQLLSRAHKALRQDLAGWTD